VKFGILGQRGALHARGERLGVPVHQGGAGEGHEIYRVFFYHDGVNNATKYTEPPQDDRQHRQPLSKLAAERTASTWSSAWRRAAPRHQGRSARAGVPHLGARPAGRGGHPSDRLVVFGLRRQR